MTLPRSSFRTPRRLGASPTGRMLLIGIAFAWLGCSSPPPREPIQLPATISLRAASETLMDRVEVDDHAPEWLNRDRVEDGVIYGIGIQSGGRDDAEDLFLAMHAARRSVVVWLESRGAGGDGAVGHEGAMRIDPERIQFERLARNEKTDRWYALARLEIAPEAAAIEAKIATLERELAILQARVVDPGVADDARAQAALAIVQDVALRSQYDSLYHALTGGEVATPAGLEDAALLSRANELLSAHGVRVVVDGGFVPGLYEAVGAVLAEFNLRTDEFGRGLVAVQVSESRGFGPDNPYLEVDGHVEVAIEGGDARGFTTPFHAVSTGATLDEARFRAAREIRAEVERIVRRTLQQIASKGA